MLKIGDKVEVTNIRGNYEPKTWKGKIVGLYIYIGEQGVVKNITKNRCYDVVVELNNGECLGFKERELMIIE